MNPVLDMLCCDHTNFAKLMNIIEQQAEVMTAGCEPDYEILTKAVEYLERYPALYHHPLEDRLCQRLKNGAAGLAPAIDATLQQHEEIRSRLSQFKRLLEEAKSGAIVSRTAFAEAAADFVSSEWMHMEFERTELFPVALAALIDDDWAALENELSPVADDLFGASLDASLQRLHALLLESDSKDKTRDILNATNRQ
jgi:hemerythrin-like domain-containing protein